MRRLLGLTLLAAGCGMDVIDCIDLGGGCGPDEIGLRSPGLADNESPIHAALGGSYRLGVEGGTGEVSVDGADHMGVEAIDDRMLSLRGRSEGQDQLHIRQGESAPATHWVRVFALDRVILLPRELAFSQATSATPFALLAGVETELFARLLATGDERLVDQDLIVVGDTVAASRWDAFRVTAPAGRSIFLDLVTSERADGFSIPVVSGIDDIVPVVVGDALDANAIPTTSSLSLLCFAGVSAGLPVAGLSWEIVGDGVSVPNNASLAAGGCVYVSEVQDGQILTVRTSGLERSFTLHTQ